MFVCGPEKDAKKRIRKLEDLKQLTEAIQNKMLVPCSLVCCPGCCPEIQEPVKEAPPAAQPPDVMVCYKVGKVERKRANRPARKEQAKRTKRAKSRELRASILYRGCDCEKRNGLQDDCRRTGCQGSPECLSKPNPICGPSEFSNGKHLGKIFDKELRERDDDGCDDDRPERITYSYNCYPAAIVA